MMNVFGSLAGDLTTFLQLMCPDGPQRIPLLQYNTENSVEPSINRLIMAGSYRQQMRSWLPGGSLWRNRIYCCHPFEIVLTDFSLNFGEVQEFKKEADCPVLVKRADMLFETTSYLRGDWINYFDREPKHWDQIGLYSSVTGVGRQRAILDLISQLKIDFAERDTLLFEKPHDGYQIRALYDEKNVPKKFEQSEIDVNTAYCFRNANNSIRGWGYKVTWDGQQYLACLTPWRNRKDSSEWVWQPFGFEKPHPFYGADLLERHPDAVVVLTEDMNLADSARNKNQQPSQWLVLSWIGGEESVTGLDWQSLLGREVHCLAVDDAEGRRMALHVYESARDSGVTIKDCYWLRAESEQGARYNQEVAEEYIKGVRKELGLPKGEGPEFADSDGKLLGDFLKEDIKKEPFLLDSFVKADDFVIIAAPKKTSKSFLALDLAMALASGEGFGMRFSAPEARRVTFVDAEMGEGMLQDRARNIKRLYKNGGVLDKNLLLLSLNGMKKKLNLIQEKDRAWVETKMAPNTKLLVLDNLGKLIPPHKEFSEREWRSIEEWIRTLNRRGVGVVLVTHMTKSGSVVRGTGKILDDANTVVTLRRPDKWTQANGNKVEFHFYGRDLSDEQLEPFGIQYKTRSGRFFRNVCELGEAFEGDRFVFADEIERFDLNALQVDMLELARSKGEVRAGDFKTESGKPSASTVSKYLKSLCVEPVKLLRKEGEGNQARYYPVYD